jgi:hypothetical protein
MAQNVEDVVAFVIAISVPMAVPILTHILRRSWRRGPSAWQAWSCLIAASFVWISVLLPSTQSTERELPFADAMWAGFFAGPIVAAIIMVVGWKPLGATPRQRGFDVVHRKNVGG